MILQIEDDLTRLLQSAEQPAEKVARELIVLELYRLHRISIGKAAQLQDESIGAFLQRAAKVGIPYFDWPESDIASEIEPAGRLSGDRSL